MYTFTAPVHLDAGIYEDPWNTEQTMEKLLSGIGLDGQPDDVRLYNTTPHIIKQSTFDSSSLQNSHKTSSLSKGTYQSVSHSPRANDRFWV